MRRLLVTALLLSTASSQPPDPDPKALWEATRRNTLDFVSNTLPYLICTESLRRYQSLGRKGQWYPAGTLKFQVTYFNSHEKIKLLAREDHATSQKTETLSGAWSQGEFAGTLALVFQPETRAAFQWRAWTRWNGRRVAVYSYHVEDSHSRYIVRVGTRAFVVSYSGVLYIDPEMGRVVRLFEIADFPQISPIRQASTDIEYGMVTVFGNRLLLPVRAQWRSADAQHARFRNDIEFGDYFAYTPLETGR
jgi:hypothetical protein